jgi:outer membrane immunogenic protein
MRSSVGARLSALAGAALLIASSSAWAQSPKDPWSGFYAGINAGYAAQDGSARLAGDNPVGDGAGNAILRIATGNFDISSPDYSAFSQSLPLSAEGFIGGAQVGYAFRVAPALVVGVEADFQMGGADDRASTSGAFGTTTLGVTTRHELQWFGTLRGRLGYLVSDRLLIFGSGGLAVGKSETEGSLSNLSAPGVLFITANTTISNCVGGQTCLAGSSSRQSAGFVFGGGFEWALTNTITLKAEYLRLDLGSETVRMTTVAPTTGNAFVDVKVKHAYDIARMGLNVRF